MKVLVFEGIDGVGKSTCVELAKSHFEGKQKKVLVIKSPAILNSKFDSLEFLKVDDHVYFFLYLAQLEAIEQELYDLRTKGEVDIVILDRHFSSTYVYSKLLKIRKSKRKAFASMLFRYYEQSFKPNLIIYCLAPFNLILSRLKHRKEFHKPYLLDFANKLFLKRHNVEKSSTVLVCEDMDRTQKDLIKKLKSLD